MLGVVSRQRRAALRRPGFTSFRLGVADGSTVACETAVGVAYAISIDGGRPIPLGVRVSTFSEVDFSPDGSLLAVGAYDPTVTTVSAYVARRWIARDEAPVRRLQLRQVVGRSRIALCGYHPNTSNPTLAIVGSDGINLRLLAYAICSDPVYSPDGSVACVDFAVDRRPA